MSIFNSLGKGSQQPAQQAQVNAQQAFSELQSDPIGVLSKIGLNVPAGMTNPQQIVNHLMQTGQVPQSRLAQVMQMMMGRR